MLAWRRTSLMSTVRKHAKQRGDIASSQIYKDLNSDREGGHDLYFWRHILPLSVTPPPLTPLKQSKSCWTRGRWRFTPFWCIVIKIKAVVVQDIAALRLKKATTPSAFLLT